MRVLTAKVPQEALPFPAASVLLRKGWLSERSASVQCRLLAGARRRDFVRDEAIYFAGAAADGLYGLISGALEIRFPGDDGLETCVHRADPGFWIGDLALFSEQPRLVSVIATGTTEMLFLPQPLIRRLVREDPAILRDFYDLTHRNMELALRLLANLSICQSERRLGLRLLHYRELCDDPDGWLGVSQEDLAQLVAVSLPTLQRVLRRFAEEGWVEIGYRKLRVSDPEALAQRYRN